MKKTGLLLAAGLLAAGLAMPAQAESYTGSTDWKVAFTGSAMESNFKTSQMDEAISALQPGDTVKFQVDLYNNSGTTTEWYMTNQVLQSLEDSQKVAGGGAYSYRLSYTNLAGAEQVLYDSSAVGGEKSTAAGEGLHEATDSLKSYFYLDEVAAGGSGKVDLAVSLEGETQGNAYQDTLAALQMNFAVELSSTQRKPTTPTPTPNPLATATPAPTATPAASSSASSSSGTGTSTKTSATPRVRVVYTSSIPQTGDAGHPLLIAVLCGVSGLALLGLVIFRVRKNRQDKHKKQGEEPHE